MLSVYKIRCVRKSDLLCESQETFALWVILLYNCVTGKCCLWSIHSPLHPGMYLSADLFIVPFPSFLHRSYLELQRTAMFSSSPANWCNASSCLHEKHFSTFIKTKCNSFSFINRMISCKIVLTKSCTFLLKWLPILNGYAAQIYPPDQNKSKLNFRPHQQCPFFRYEPFH